MAENHRPVQFLELLRTLTSHDVRFIVVGGVAAVLEGAPIATFDLDVLYACEAGNIARLSAALESLDAVYVDPAGRRIRPTAERLFGGGHHLLRTRFGRLDVMGSIGSGQSFEQLLPRSRNHDLHGLTIQVLRLDAIIETKEAAGRPKDRAVLAMLRELLAAQE